jgi:hypothetical protein
MKHFLILILAINLFQSCKKDVLKDSDDKPYFRFSYKGKTYNDKSYGALLSGTTMGIVIHKPDLFGGDIYFPIRVALI